MSQPMHTLPPAPDPIDEDDPALMQAFYGIGDDVTGLELVKCMESGKAFMRDQLEKRGLRPRTQIKVRLRQRAEVKAELADEFPAWVWRFIHAWCLVTPIPVSGSVSSPAATSATAVSQPKPADEGTTTSGGTTGSPTVASTSPDAGPSVPSIER